MYDTDVGICRPGKWKLLILLLQKAVRHVLAELLFVWEKAIEKAKKQQKNNQQKIKMEMEERR